MIDIFLGAVIFALWGTTLFYGKIIGFSMLLFVIPITFFMIHILEKRHKDLNKKAKILMIPIFLLASTYLIYNNLFFNLLNILVIPTLVVLMILGLYKEKFEIKFNMIGKILKVVFKPFEYIGEAFKKSRKIFKQKEKTNIDLEKSKNIKRIVKAVCITIPIVFVVIWLLSSADQIFGNIFGNIAETITNWIEKIEFDNAIEIIIITICSFIYFLGFFYYISSKYKNSEIKEDEKKKDSFTIKMILGVLNVIYLIFCFIQIKSLFMKHVNINYAEYARQGFFQLMLVSLINLITLLIAKKREIQDETKTRYIKIMCILMVVFTFIILISAAYRMYLYESAYGYTFLRLLVYCILFTEAVLLIPTVIYILDKKINLPIAYFTIILSIYICMNFANFDNIIAKRNVDRYIKTGKIDLLYLEMGTGTDAVKQITRILDEKENEVGIKPETRRYLKFMHEYLESEGMDFRDLNISRIIAKNEIEQKIDNLEEIESIEGIENIKEENHTNVESRESEENKENKEKYDTEKTEIIENFYGIVRTKKENEIGLSYTNERYEFILKYIYLKNEDINKVNLGDWITGTGIVIGRHVNYNAKKIQANKIKVVSEKEYKKELEKYIYGKDRIFTQIDYNYESEGRGDGFVYCSIYKEDSEIPYAFVKINYDQNTKIYLGNPDSPVSEKYDIIEHELAEIVFRKKVKDVNEIINAETIAMIAD